MTAGIAYIRDLHPDCVWQLLLSSKTPSLSSRNLRLPVECINSYGCEWSTIHQSGRNVVDVAAVNRRRVHQRRISESIETIIILADTFVEDACAASYCCLAIAKNVIRKTQARSKVIPAVLSTAFRQAIRSLSNYAIVRVTRSRNDRALTWNLSRRIARNVDLHCLARIIQAGIKVIFVVRTYGIRRPGIHPAKPIVEGQLPRSLPGVLRVGLILLEVEVAKGINIGLGDIGVVAKKRICRRVDVREVETQRRLIVSTLRCALNNVHDLAEVVPTEDRFIRQRR